VPIMASVGSGRKFQPAPPGVHQAVCVDVVDLGLLEVTYGGKTKQQHKIRIVWQIEELMDDMRPFIVQKRYTLSLSEKANLRKDLESWRGRAFTETELEAFDVETVLGANCLLNVMRVDKEGESYANITAVMPIKKGMPKLTIRDYVRVVDRTDTQTVENDDGPLTVDDIPF
jgi:hypothetical protein